MTKQEALAIARREVSNAEMNLCRAQKINAEQGDLYSLKRKLEYKKYIMEAVEVKKEKNCLLSYSDLEKMHGKPVFCVWPPDEYGAVATKWLLVNVDKSRNEIVFTNNRGGKHTWDELLESDVAFYRYEV